jgi:N-acetylmuramoyl-L-alanine amidase
MGTYHTVKQGECLSSLAKRFGYVDFETIYDHAENAELKKLRPNPNIIFPGDVVYVPEHEIKELDRATEALHSFILESSKTLFRLRIKDSEDKAFANRPYELNVDDKVFDGKTDGDGRMEQEIPADARNGSVILYKTSAKTGVVAVITLNFGHLDPVQEISGIQSRLNNLGFGSGRVDGKLGPKTKAALIDFQRKFGLSETGQPDEQTKAALEQAHEWN